MAIDQAYGGRFALAVEIARVAGYDLVMLGEQPGGAAADAEGPAVTHVDADALPALRNMDLSRTVLVCAAPLQQLHDPRPLLAELARLGEHCAYLLVAAPDRERAVSPFDPALPPRTGDARWSAGEFHRLLVAQGFPRGALWGHLREPDGRRRSVAACLAGREAAFRLGARRVSVAAILNLFNEADIIEPVIRYLAGQGIAVHLFDNWSDDGSWEICARCQAEGLVASLRRFPDAPSDEYDWSRQLRNTSRYAAELSADWVLHYDADELRSAPWPDVPLVDAISFIDGLGYSAIDFTILNFLFVDEREREGFDPDNFPYFEWGRHPAHFVQIKGWKNLGTPVDLAASGGHSAEFPDRRVYPLKFLTRHYPLRSMARARTKVFRDRIPRARRERRERGWHTHYDVYAERGVMLAWNEWELTWFDPLHFHTEYLAERLTGLGVARDERALISFNSLVELGRQLLAAPAAPDS